MTTQIKVNLLDMMYEESEAIRAEIEFSNDISMAQVMYRMHEDGLDPSHLGHGHPMREKIYQMYVETGSPMLNRAQVNLLFH